MKASVMAVLFGMLISMNAGASWFGSNNNGWGNNGWDDNDWPEWTPMYWMEEMADSFDDNDDYGRYGYGPRHYGPYGQPYGQPYGYQNLPAPVPPQAKAETK